MMRAIKKNGLSLVALLMLVVTASAQGQQPIGNKPSTQQLELNQPIERTLAGGETHIYRLTLKAGEYVHLEVMQRGMDVVLALYAPDGKKLLERDSPNSTDGPEPLSHIATFSGNYRLEVSSFEKKAAAGQYSLELNSLRVPTEQDRKRSDAETAFNEAVSLRENDIARALRKYVESLRLWRELDEKYWEALTTEGIGEISRTIYAGQQAAEWYAVATKLYFEIGDTKRAQRALESLGQTCIILKQWENARKAYEQALVLAKKRNDQTAIETDNGWMNYATAEQNFNDGMIWKNVGNQQKAVTLIKQAISIFHELEAREREQEVLTELGRIYETLRQWGPALESYENAIKLMREIDDRDQAGRKNKGTGKGEKGQATDDLNVDFIIDHRKQIGLNSKRIETIRKREAAGALETDLVVQTGHSSPITSVAFSPDGKTLASLSPDGAIKLWDVASGTELRAIEALGNFDVKFSPDGKVLASGGVTSGGLNGVVKLWDVASGAELRSFEGYNGIVSSIAFSPDGQTLSSGSFDKTIKLWEVSTGKEIKTLAGHSAYVAAVAFSPDGKTLASGSSDKTIKLWDVATGKEIKTFSGHAESVGAVAFSPDGKSLASGSKDKTIRLWDTASGTELRAFKAHVDSVTSVAFSPDGKTLVSGGGNENQRVSQENSIQLWDVASGAEVHPIMETSVVNSVIFSPDGKILAGGSGTSGFGNKIKLWDVASGAEIRTLTTHSYSVDSVAFSLDGKTLASGNWGRATKLWDLANGAGIQTLTEQTSEGSVVRSLAYSPDGKLLASGSGKEINLWEMVNKTEKLRFAGHSALIISIAFSPDGKTFASASMDNTIKLWEVTSGRALKTLTGHDDAVLVIAFSPDGKTLASGSGDGTIKLWDVANGTERLTLGERSRYAVTSVAFSPDGKTLASGSQGKTIRLWDAETGVMRHILSGHFSTVNSVVFSPDGRTLASGSNDKIIKLWDMATKQELSLPNRLPDWINFSNHLAVENINGLSFVASPSGVAIEIVNPITNQILATLIAIDESDWLVTTPEGLFDGSPKAWKQLTWRFDNNTFKYAPVEAFFKEFYYPGLLQEIMAGKEPKPPTKELSEIDTRQPQVRITQADEQALQAQALGQPVTLANPVSQRTVMVTLEITENSAAASRGSQPLMSGAQDLRLFRNGSLVKLWQGDVFGPESGCAQATTKPNELRRALCKTAVPIIAGANELTAYAFNHENVKSSDAVAVIKGAESLKRPGKLYILAVGVNRYANSQYDLRWAVADAEEFAAEIKRQQERLGRFEKIEIISLFDAQATKANFLDALNKLTPTVQPEDALIVYFSGHGTAAGNRFYLIPHDLGYQGQRDKLNEASLRTILAHSISDQELERAFEGIDAGQTLLVIDACNSGQALEAEEKRRGPMNSKGLAQLAWEKGMYILTAAQSYQQALENSKLGHGYLTYALIDEGLRKGLADGEPKDGTVLIREWLNYAMGRVPQMQSEGLGRELHFSQSQGPDKLAERNTVQRPRVFYRRELESVPLIISRN